MNRLLARCLSLPLLLACLLPLTACAQERLVEVQVVDLDQGNWLSRIPYAGRDYIEGRVVEDLPARIRAAHAGFAGDRDIVLIEGTGHAGVGAVIGLSNAVVARMLSAPAIIVSEGGVGRPIDEIVLNAALFEREGVHVGGAIVNKVNLGARPDLGRVLEKGLERLAAVDPQQSRVVELRFFGGLSVEETAAVLKISPETVMRDWKLARTWLRRELRR
jgi:hypothetical protein